mmetsp:Transcript_23599/g.27844  ORF Transcript_23599/g.27844 Transcript_23599/m.27844 type:complete len:133 (+) Transcript_23599:53-451(+)|eukprot:CAMPEP_0198264252 /NCGR_PEP_ID=MMETSP1447-20131203/14977_1 /TAXON_ID=420782 /ORGANISM="Chaetoceros dichaeta, Strain CCMP1751" /LENGTH=132 /DNA_ID=CAMNT_0043953125 /DNA_START=46 /DNA_END=444 /DNA_ORIENTATION=-
MATRGVKQLLKLRLVYCEHGGSSRSIREYLSSGKIVDFATVNPSVKVIAQLRNGKHPYVKAEYLTGSDKQVCIKNESLERIERVVQMLNDTSGRKITKIGGPIRSLKPTVQGVWTPMLDIAHTKFNIEMVED